MLPEVKLEVIFDYVYQPTKVKVRHVFHYHRLIRLSDIIIGWRKGQLISSMRRERREADVVRCHVRIRVYSVVGVERGEIGYGRVLWRRVVWSDLELDHRNQCLPESPCTLTETKLRWSRLFPSGASKIESRWFFYPHFPLRKPGRS